MSKQTDYAREEWKTIVSAPIAAGLLVSISDMSGPVGMVKEAFAVVKAITETAANTNNELIQAIAAEVQARRAKPETPSGDAASIRRTLIDGCRQAVELVTQKSPGEAEEYRRWLLQLAQSTADAAKEGGFLGIGGTQVSDDERGAVKDLASAIGASS